jgi:hypothetical protein
MGGLHSLPAGTFRASGAFSARVGLCTRLKEAAMGGIIYIVGLIVIILAILSFFGLR